jgi:alpha-mannosidase
LSLDSPGVILSGIKQAEDGNELIVRLVEIEGKETTINFKLPVEISSVRRLNLIELPLENVAKPEFNGKSIQVRIAPHEIVTLGIIPVK